MAVDVATGQGAALWLIRAVLDRVAHGGPADGLAEVVERFPATAALPELTQARALLAVS
jgi:hypothetical protein